MNAHDEVDMVIITGISGAGKTQALRFLEDLGYFCVDNLPPLLVPKFADLFEPRSGEVDKVAIVMDVRGGHFFEGLAEALNYLDQAGFSYELLFLESSDEALLRRYKETRRRHPLSQEGGVMEGILEERKRLDSLRERAGKIIDTSELTPRQLKEKIEDIFSRDGRSELIVTVMSFGFKHGIPLDADLVMDVRFLPNPHYIKSLRPLTGEDQEVYNYVLNSPVTQEFLSKYTDLLRFVLPYYVREGKSYLVIAVGCTGGRHRSVTLAGKLKEFLDSEQQDMRVVLQHRDLKNGE